MDAHLVIAHCVLLRPPALLRVAGLPALHLPTAAAGPLAALLRVAGVIVALPHDADPRFLGLPAAFPRRVFVAWCFFIFILTLLVLLYFHILTLLLPVCPVLRVDLDDDLIVHRAVRLLLVLLDMILLVAILFFKRLLRHVHALLLLYTDLKSSMCFDGTCTASNSDFAGETHNVCVNVGQQPRWHP